MGSFNAPAGFTYIYGQRVQIGAPGPGSYDFDPDCASTGVKLNNVFVAGSAGRRKSVGVGLSRTRYGRRATICAMRDWDRDLKKTASLTVHGYRAKVPTYKKKSRTSTISTKRSN